MVCLETERLVIRDHIPGDLNPMHKLLSDKKAMYYLQDIRTETLEGTRQNLAEALSENGRASRVKYYFAVVEKKSGAYIGEIGFTVKVKSPLGCIAGLGYFILPEHWGRGYTTEAARAVLRYAFEEAGAVKVETGCIRGNAASEAVMKKLGMISEAYFKMHVWHDGQWKDRVEYGLTRDEWQKAQTV